jgi:hypothetical protein
VVREDAQVIEQKGITTMKNHEATEATQTAAVAEQGALVAPAKAASKKAATQKKGAPKGQETAKGAKAKAAAPTKAANAAKKAAKPARAKEASAPRAETKGAKIIEMIGRAKGATLADIMKATDWQAHSVRGFISIAAKKHSINIESSKNEAGDRVYKIAK